MLESAHTASTIVANGSSDSASGSAGGGNEQAEGRQMESVKISQAGNWLTAGAEKERAFHRMLDLMAESEQAVATTHAPEGPQLGKHAVPIAQGEQTPAPKELAAALEQIHFKDVAWKNDRMVASKEQGLNLADATMPAKQSLPDARTAEQLESRNASAHLV